MSILYVNFRTRQLTDTHETRAIYKPKPEPMYKNELERIFAEYDEAIQGIKNRFGDNPPKDGVVYKTKMSKTGFDTYGRGCVHNSIHQYLGETDSKRGHWNRPFPLPADLRAIDKVLKNHKGSKRLKVGLKSDPFMWMDRKYSITQSVLKLANEYGVKLELHTMSDLCACEEYLDLLRSGDHSIVMHMGFDHLKFQDTAKLDRLTCPGAPSRLRRTKAIEALDLAGVSRRAVYTDIVELIKNPYARKQLEVRTGYIFGDSSPLKFGLNLIEGAV